MVIELEESEYHFLTTKTASCVRAGEKIRGEKRCDQDEESKRECISSPLLFQEMKPTDPEDMMIFQQHTHFLSLEAKGM